MSQSSVRKARRQGSKKRSSSRKSNGSAPATQHETTDGTVIGGTPPPAPPAVSAVDAIDDGNGNLLHGVLIVQEDGDDPNDPAAFGVRLVKVGDAHPSGFLTLTRLGHLVADALVTPGRRQ